MDMSRCQNGSDAARAIVSQLERPAANTTDSIFCMELTMLELESFDDVVNVCFPNADFDLFDPVQLAALPTSVSTCSGKHSQKPQLCCSDPDPLMKNMSGRSLFRIFHRRVQSEARGVGGSRQDGKGWGC